MELSNIPHKRYNPLNDEWVLVSPHRRQRPWQGQQEKSCIDTQPSHDPNCYLCPGSIRAGGEKNPQYQNTFVFTNDFAALLPKKETINETTSALFKAVPESGICKVICFSPRHDLSISRMEISGIKAVVSTWKDEYETLGSNQDISYVQIFENRGESMGCSNPHPHGQIWATESIPTIAHKEQLQQKQYLDHHDSCLLCDYIKEELEKKERLVFENNSFAAIVPYWALWPFETMIVSKRHIGSLSQFTKEEMSDLADAMKRMGTRFDNLFATSFPYSMGLHQQPTDDHDHPEWHFHIHYYPPLLRSATVKKFMVGFEMLGMPQRDLTAEESADRLLQQSETHFLET